MPRRADATGRRKGGTRWRGPPRTPAPSCAPAPGRAPAGSCLATVTALGGHGDGLAEDAEGRRLFIPFTVPGDRVRARPLGPVAAAAGSGWRAELLEVLAPGPDRVAPACAHFGRCGGCSLQHLEDSAYAAWKRQRVVEALARQGLEAPVGELVRAAPGDRRRLRLAARHTAAGTVLGFQARRSHQIVDLAGCPVADPVLVALLPALRTLLARLLPPAGQADVALLAGGSGVDMAIIGGPPPDLAAREALAAFAEARDLARLAWAASDRDPPETILRRRPVRIRFAEVEVEPPPLGFLQAAAPAQAALIQAVREGVGEVGPVVELFAGSGTFTLPLAADGARVTAYESDASAVAALLAASVGAGLAGRVTAMQRDLERRPLLPGELSGAGAAVFDPPRAGAARQAASLAGSTVPRVVGVSCNPASFARDARLLVSGGYRLERVLPVDQFLWSPHVELVGSFRR